MNVAVRGWCAILSLLLGGSLVHAETGVTPLVIKNGQTTFVAASTDQSVPMYDATGANVVYVAMSTADFTVDDGTDICTLDPSVTQLGAYIGEVGDFTPYASGGINFTTTTSCPAADCDASGEYGRWCPDTDEPRSTLKFCFGAAGWRTLVTAIPYQASAATDTIAADNTTRYLSFATAVAAQTTESAAESLVSAAFTITAMACGARTAPGSAKTRTFTVRSANANTAIACTISGTTGKNCSWCVNAAGNGFCGDSDGTDRTDTAAVALPVATVFTLGLTATGTPAAALATTCTIWGTVDGFNAYP